MSYYHHPDVGGLKVIADNWWRERRLIPYQSFRTNTPHDARALARLVSTSCWAVQDPYSETVRRFCKGYRKAQALDLRRMRDSEIEKVLGFLFGDIDDLFFFSMLNSKPDGLHHLTSFEVTDKGFEGSKGVCTWEDGKRPVITIWRAGEHRTHRTFEQLLHTFIHESVHVFLGLFSDNRHPRHQEWLTIESYHGEMFWVLLGFIMGRVKVITKSERWQKEVDDRNRDRLAMVRAWDKHESWGTPEKTLMGGVLKP
ncbi:hypothetical protein F5X97DRAFT_328843 [Nemania serpens]|nr:hypothetical protein F5X97DRAFT_328843 [Nemania serpens]